MKSLRFLLTFAWLCLPLFSVSAAPRKRAVLNLFCWSEYVPEAVVRGFEKETGIRVNMETYASNEEMLSKLLGGAARYDLAQPSEYTTEALVKAGKLEPLNLANIPNVKNLDPQFLQRPHDPAGKFSVPWMTGTVGIVVNTAKVKVPVEGYADVFSGRYTGRIVVLKDAREIVTWAAATLGLAPNALNAETLERVKPVLAQWLPQVRVFDSDSPKTALLNGDADIGIVWSGEAALLWKEDRKFRYVLPKEGAHQFIDSLVVPKGAANQENAERFIDYILRPDVSVQISEAFPYTNPNAEARKLLSPDALANPASYPPGEPKLETFHDIGRLAAAIDRLVTDLRAR